MKINIWIRRTSLADLNYCLSENFGWDKEMSIDIWYSNPNVQKTNEYLSVSLTYEQYKKLEDL